MTTTMPMFPLNAVVFPTAHIPLHVFEPRYRALVHDCLAGDGRFGTVLIERGSEVGGGDVRFTVGTRLQLTQTAELPDGRWIISAAATDRIRVHDWLPDDPYPRAEVTVVDEPPGDGGDDSSVDDLTRLLRRSFALASELGEPVGARGQLVELDPDPVRAIWQAAALAPISTLDAQRVLEADDQRERRQLLEAALADAVDLFARRLSDH